MSRSLCIHGHFYQPPRENPWLEAIEQQDSAYPYHDWNERVTAECYAPNAASRVLDEEGRIVRIVNNYERMSFNVGPTLLAWMEARAPEVYAAILEADARSRERFDGHGSALAQVYNHMILPLANERDRRTQVRWGIADFEHRFGRSPEGMWLPETAVDLDSLEALAAAGIRFTVLAPHQAARVRPLAGGEWRNVSGGKVDPSRPYLQRLPSGREIALFFYDGPISRAVAFERLLRDGARFADRLLDTFPERQGPRLAHIATDGETYGHHHTHGEMALSFALARIEEREDVELVNYPLFLDRHPPEHEVEIVEDTSWSCAHGIERWRSDCGCRTGGDPDWNQAWRAPLREALDRLRDRLVSVFQRRASALLEDPWAARDAYIQVILDRSPESLDRFFGEHAAKPPQLGERTRLLELLEMQRHAMLMYTSCGWFFNDLAGIETVQVLQYAGRAVQLAERVSSRELRSEFTERLAEARSNLPEQGSGRRIYRRRVEPAKVNLEKVCGHYAVRSLIEGPEEESRDVYCYTVTPKSESLDEAGRARLLTGVAEVSSRITEERESYGFAAFYFGDHNVQAGVRPFRGAGQGAKAFREVQNELADAFGRADFPATLRLIDGRFGEEPYSLHSMFRDEQRRIVERILQSRLEEMAGIFRDAYERHAPLMRFVADLGIPQPAAFEAAGEFVLNLSLRRALEAEDLRLDRIESLLDDAVSRGVELDAPGLAFAFRAALEREGRGLEADPRLPRLRRFRSLVELSAGAPFAVNLWEVQNIYYGLLQDPYPSFRAEAERGNDEAREWTRQFERLGELLSVAVGA